MRNDNQPFTSSDFRVTPPRIPNETHRPDTHTRRDDEALFDEPVDENSTLHYTKLAEMGRNAISQEKGEQKILEAVRKLPLPVEIQMQITADPEIKDILKYYGHSPSEQEATAIVAQIAAKQADRERQALEKLGFSFDADNTLILDENGEQAHSYENVKRRLEKLNQLTEVAYYKPADPSLKEEPTYVEAAKETVIDHVEDDLRTSGIDATTIGNALSAELKIELEDSNYVSGETGRLLSAIDKTIRAFENRGKFTLDLYGDPQPIGFLKRIQNRLFGGRVSDSQKSSREYRNILALQTLRDAINSQGPVHIKHPTAESFAPIDRTAQRSPISSRPLRFAGAAGIAAGVAAGAYGYDRSQPQTDFDEVTTTAPAQTKEASTKETRIADEIKILPRLSDDEVVPRARRASVADYTIAARNAEAETSLERTPWETATPTKKEASKKLAKQLEVAKTAAKTAKEKRLRIDAFADHSVAPDAAKAPEFYTPDEEEVTPVAPTVVESPRERAPKLKSLESNKPKLESPKTNLDSFSERIAKAKKTAAELRARQAKAKAVSESLIPSSQIKKATSTEFSKAKKTETAKPIKIKAEEAPTSESTFSSPIKKIESALQNRFGANADRYLKALPNDVKSALSELSPAQARALLADKIINIHNDPKISADRITALHVAKEALKGI